MATRVFVYGTLRRGQYNHPLLAGASYVGDLITEPRFTMIDMGGYPGVLDRGTTAIVGEVYDVDVVTLARLDLLEEVPTLYRRRWLQLTEQATAMMYLLPERFSYGAPIMSSGDWCTR